MNYSLLTLLIFALVIGLAFIYKKRKLNTSNPKKVSVAEIWILGIIANVISIRLLLIRLNSSYENIHIKGDLSPSIVSGNIKITIIHFLICIGFIVGALILWSQLNKLKKRKQIEWEDNELSKDI